MSEEKSSPKETQGQKSDAGIATLAHVLGIFIGFVGPLIIYLTQQQAGFAKEQAKEALNFQLTVLIAYVACWFLVFILIGFALMWIVWVLNVIFCIVAAISVSKGQNYRYPIAIRFIK